MRIQAITPNYLKNPLTQKAIDKGDNKTMTSDEIVSDINDLSGMPYLPLISFSGIANSSKLRTLFAYRLPCMYTGIPMIDPQLINRINKGGIFSQPAKEVIFIFDKYKDSFVGKEQKIIEILRERAKMHPDKNIKQIIEEIEPYYRRILRKKQAPVFRELSETAETLPEDCRYKFKLLMSETDKKLNEKPLIIPFSSYEFKYKLTKIRDSIAAGATPKAQKVLNKIMKESKRLSNTTDDKTIDNQKQILKLLDHILKKSVLNGNEQLNDLIETSKARLLQEKIIVPFSRKSFLYDLGKILDDLSNPDIKEQYIKIAETLPTSNQSMSAYILKLSSEPADKIVQRILWPSLASVEHIIPCSEGGVNEMYNFGGARTVINSARKSIPFSEWINIHPEARENCQKYVDRLIELYHEGIFAKHNIDPDYIFDFAGTVYEQSKMSLQLDLSKFYEF